MPNMSYCRFENTARDLRDCLDNWDDVEAEDVRGWREEGPCKQRIIEMAREIVGLEGDED